MDLVSVGLDVKCEQCHEPILKEGEDFTRGVCRVKISGGVWGTPALEYYHARCCPFVAHPSWLVEGNPDLIEESLLRLALRTIRAQKIVPAPKQKLIMGRWPERDFGDRLSELEARHIAHEIIISGGTIGDAILATRWGGTTISKWVKEGNWRSEAIANGYLTARSKIG